MLSLLHLSMLVVLTTALGPPEYGMFQELVASQRSADSSRLSGEVVPNAYTITLRFEDDFAETNTFTGSVIIDITVREITTSDSSFQFHAKDLKIESMMLNKTKETIPFSSKIDPITDFVTLIPSDRLEPGNYSLLINYTGVLSETDMTGLYKSSYVDNTGNKHFLVASQFQSRYARKAFPCFDEPAMKATFEITVIYPKGYHVKSNTEEDSPKEVNNSNFKQVTFPKTPKMSTYLVAILVSDFNCKQGANFNSTVKVELCYPIDANDTSTHLALIETNEILEFMSKFTDYTYGDISKVTLAAVPDILSGTMENWGLLTFRESILLWTRYTSSYKQRGLLLRTLAHELAHQWFGNLVTFSWWNDLFLSEGLATLFSYYVADHFDPIGKHLEQFVLDEVQPALHKDSLGSSLPLSLSKDRKGFAIRRNDIDMSYAKGASIIRMVQYLPDFKDFQTGIRRYIAKHKMGNATPAQLWESFTEFESYCVNRPLTTLMNNWVNKPGYPLLFVDVRETDIVISQEKYSLSKENTDTKWYVPIVYRSSAEKIWKRNMVKPSTELRLVNVLQDSTWLILNNQRVGFYRVHYHDAILSKISAALHQDINTIDEISRAVLVDDQFSLALSGRKTYRDVFKFLTFLKNDDSYYSWSAAINGFTYLLQHTVSESIRKHIIDFIKEHMETINRKTKTVLDLDFTADAILMPSFEEVKLASWRCKLNDTKCFDAANTLFHAFERKHILFTPVLKFFVYCNGLRNSTDICETHKFLWQKYLETRNANEKVTILKALGCTPTLHTREHILRKAFSGGAIRYQDVQHVLTSMYNQGPDAVTAIIKFLTEHYKSIINRIGIIHFNIYITSAADYINMQSQIDILTRFSKIESLDPEIVQTVNSAIEKGKWHLDIIKRIEGEFWKTSGAPTLSGTVGLVILGCTLILF